MPGDTEHDEPDLSRDDGSPTRAEMGVDRSTLDDVKRGPARSTRDAATKGSTRPREITRALVPSVALILVIAVPTMVVEEEWGGRPMIEQGNLLWLVPAALVVLAFFLGGTSWGSGRDHRPRPRWRARWSASWRPRRCFSEAMCAAIGSCTRCTGLTYSASGSAERSQRSRLLSRVLAMGGVARPACGSPRGTRGALADADGATGSPASGPTGSGPALVTAHELLNRQR